MYRLIENALAATFCHFHLDPRQCVSRADQPYEGMKSLRSDDANLGRGGPRILVDFREYANKHEAAANRFLTISRL